MNAQEIISSGILELYCTGLTSAAETAEVQQWAKLYPEVAAEIAAIESGLEGYAQAHAVAPGASVKDKLFAGINKGTAATVVKLQPVGNGTAKIHSISPAWKYAAAASIILLVGSLMFNYTFYEKYQTASKDLQVTQNELEQQKQVARSMEGDMRKMGDKNAMPVSLKGMPDVPDAAARIYWMQDSHEIYIDPSNLPKAPEGKQYQFWAIVDGKPVNGGIISTEINGKTVHFQQMKSFGNAQAFAVSLEDAGPEKPVPTKVMVMGKMQTSL
ncbi:MAG TPA: anti-sigma factor [Ferruginibacter sp.]|nr:anti-sigma factor [Ferruginibacter sp.]HQY12183.1 anti-sigma factor [Ferruginibacter sp.]